MNRTGTHLTDAVAQQWVDGALAGAEAARAAEHTASCPDCAALAESYRSLAAALDALPSPDVPDDFTARVLARVEERDRATARERRVTLAVLAGIAVALAGALVLGGGAWLPNVARIVGQLGTIARAVRIGAQVLTPVMGVLGLPIATVCAFLCIPLLLALSRLTLSSRTEAT